MISNSITLILTCVLFFLCNFLIIDKKQVFLMQKHNLFNSPLNKSHISSTPQPQSHRFINSKSMVHLNKLKEESSNFSALSLPPKSLHSSNIYTKQGMLKRNDIGWEGVKLTEYVTEQLAQNYLQHQRIIQKFKREAEESRRIKKFGHTLQSQISQHSHTSQKPKHFLPRISSSIHCHHHSNLPYQQQNVGVESEEQVKTCQQKNSKMNENQLSHCQKYIKLKNKYKELKLKYKRERQLRQRQQQKIQQIQTSKCQQAKSINNIKNLSNNMMEMSMSLSFLAKQLKYLEKQRIKPINKINQQNLKQQHIQTITKKQQPQQQNSKKESLILCELHPQQNIQSVESLIKTSKSPLASDKTKLPYVVYTNKTSQKQSNKLFEKFIF